MQSCAGDGAAPDVDVVVEEVALTELSGSWAPTATDVDLTLSAWQNLDDGDFDWYEAEVSHGSTGGQRTVSDRVALEAMAKAAGYVHAERVAAEDLEAALPAFLAREGPAMMLVKVQVGNVKGIARVSHTPPEITARNRRGVHTPLL